LLGKWSSKSIQVDYTEDREFIIGAGSLRDGLKKGLKGIAKAIGSLGSFKQSNREKIRSEYKRLLSLLCKKSIIESNETAERIGDILETKCPEVQQEIRSVTGIYEKVRYGGFEPDNEEVRKFNDWIAGIRSSVTA
jgi:hypothetical protein